MLQIPSGGTGLITIEKIAEALEDVIPWRVDVVTAGAVRGRMAQVIDDAVAL